MTPQTAQRSRPADVAARRLDVLAAFLRDRGLEAEAVAAEHFAFCHDQVDPQDGRDPYTPRSYAREIRRARLWKFWWDGPALSSPCDRASPPGSRDPAQT
jgi:hypothetical protein